MATITLAALLDRMDRYQTLSAIDQVYKVRDLDEAVRALRRNHRLPWLLKKASLRVFPGIYLYPPAADHDSLAFIDSPDLDLPYGDHMRARYTSLQQFYEDPDYRNVTAEIWDTNGLQLGVRDKAVPPGFPSGAVLLDDASSIAGYTASGDAGSLALDRVNFVGGDASVRFTVTPTVLDQALVEWVPDHGPVSDADYARKYLFVWAYLSGVPDSVQLRLGSGSSDYFSSSVTAQFSGAPFKAGAWNLLAIDLNVAAQTGTVVTSALDYAAIRLDGAPAGTYGVDASSMRAWTLLDYWYYGKYLVQTNGAAAPDRESFIDPVAGTYSTDSSLIGDHEWADIAMYEAMERACSDKENDRLKADVKQWKQEAYVRLFAAWPDLKPSMTTQGMRFQTEYNSTAGPWPY